MAGVMFRSWPWRMTVLPARTLGATDRFGGPLRIPPRLAASGLGGVR